MPVINSDLDMQSSSMHIAGAALLEYSSHGPISIARDEDFASQGWPGNGTMKNPYLIENLEIQCGSKTGVRIVNTQASFLVSNCMFTSTGGGMTFSFINITNGRIENCTSSRCSWAISNSSQCRIASSTWSGFYQALIHGCTNCSFVGNYLSSNHWSGLVLDTCTTCQFADNTVMGSVGSGVWSARSINCSIQRNELARNLVGITLLGCNGTFLSDNNIHDNSVYGVEIYACGDTTLAENVLWNDGIVIHLWDWMGDGHYVSGRDFMTANYVFQNNAVNGKALGFFRDLDGGNIDASSYGQIILLSCSHVNIEHGSLNNTSVGVQILFSDNCAIRHITTANCTTAGIWNEGFNDTIIADCIISNNSRSGIYLQHSFHAMITNNSISGSYIGLGLWYSGVSFVINNTMNSNEWGIEFYSTSDCLLVNNTVVHNVAGIYLYFESNGNIIYGNTIGWNQWYNANSEGGINQWDDGISQGNRWSDYDGTGIYWVNFDVDHFPEKLAEPSSSNGLALIGIEILGGILVVAAVALVYRMRLQPFLLSRSLRR